MNIQVTIRCKVRNKMEHQWLSEDRYSDQKPYREFIMSYRFDSPSQSNKCKLFMKSESKAAYLQRCSDVEVICIVSPVTRCSTTVASNVTTYRQVTVVLIKHEVNLSPHPHHNTQQKIYHCILVMVLTITSSSH